MKRIPLTVITKVIIKAMNSENVMNYVQIMLI